MFPQLFFSERFTFASLAYVNRVNSAESLRDQKLRDESMDQLLVEHVTARETVTHSYRKSVGCFHTHVDSESSQAKPNLHYADFYLQLNYSIFDDPSAGHFTFVGIC